MNEKNNIVNSDFFVEPQSDDIGSKITADFVSIKEGISIREAMKQLIAQAADNDNISTIFVLDKDGALAGTIDLPDLIIARENTELKTIINTDFPQIFADELIEDCIERIKDYSKELVPILGADKKLLGVLTSHDVTRLVEEELEEDYAMLAGLTAEEDLSEPLKKSISKRIPWLVVLFALGMFVSAVVGMFEGVVAHLTLIVNFQSLVLAMAGNVGTQSLAVTIRVLMDEEISGRQKLFLVFKEARIGLCNGLILGIMSFVIIGVYLAFIMGESRLLSFSVSLCTGSAMAVSMLLSSISGTTIPLIFKKLKIDPAVASGPLITTINDLVAVVSYYGLAWFLLIHILNL